MSNKLIFSIISYSCLILAAYFYINGQYKLVFVFAILGVGPAVARLYYLEKAKNPSNEKEKVELETLSTLSKLKNKKP